MLSNQYRLKKKSAFAATYKIKHSFYLNGVAVFVGSRKKNSEDFTKVGFVVSKKTHKRAVKRNRLKRLMRESYRILLKENDLGISQEFKSLVFVGHEKALNLNFAQTKLTVQSLLEKIDA